MQQVYGGSLTVVTSPAANGFSSQVVGVLPVVIGWQIYNFLEGNFNYANEKFPTTFRGISSQADYWNWSADPSRVAHSTSAGSEVRSGTSCWRKASTQPPTAPKPSTPLRCDQWLNLGPIRGL